MKKYQYEDSEFGTIILYLHPTARHLIFKIRDNSLQITVPEGITYAQITQSINKNRENIRKIYVRELCSKPETLLLPYKHITKTNTCSSYTTIRYLYSAPTRQISNLPKPKESYLPVSNDSSNKRPKSICRNASIY